MFVLIVKLKGGVLLPVESNTKHPVVPESRDEQFNIFSSLAILGQRSLGQRYRPNSIRSEKFISISDSASFPPAYLHRSLFLRVSGVL